MSLMKLIVRNNRGIYSKLNQISCTYSSDVTLQEPSDNFKPLNLKHVKGQVAPRKKYKKAEVLPPRSHQMPVDQDWGNVWPGPKTFHPATVPLPLHQGYVEKGAPPGKFANAELMKIPNFLHLTPPVIKRQCEALKQFCTPWPKGLETDAKCENYFPIEIITSDYCHSSPTIRDPLARIVTLKVKLSKLQLDDHAKDKFLRLVGDKYDETTDLVTIVTDRCPTRKQNLDYAMYLLTAVYHESWTVEPWEATKSEADMEYYDWDKSVSKRNVEEIHKAEAASIPNIHNYKTATTELWNEGENDYTLNKYNEAVRQLLNIPTL
ncbi:mitochondrial ribosomal protein S35 [Carabus blaptoides fortunei]